MIKEAYISFETAKLLKEKGFDEKVSTHYLVHSSGFSEFFDKKDEFPFPEDVWLKCPTQQMAMEWLREVHYLWIDIDPLTNYKWTWSIWLMNDPNFKMGESSQVTTNYKEAVEAALKYALENLI